MSDDSKPADTTQQSIQPISQPVVKKTHDQKVHGNRYAIAHKLAIKALQNSGLSEQQVVPIVGVSRSTIMRIWQDPELDDLSPQVVTKVKNGLGGLFYKRALGASLAITPEKLEQSSALQLATVAGIMTEKGRLMEGLSTENVSFRGIAQSIESDRAKLMEKLGEIEKQ